MISVLYDGWALARQPNSPAALHLLALFAHHPPEVQAIAALPASPPPWIPGEVIVHVQPTPDSESARLRWEQRTLPRLFHELKADLLHLASASPALFGQPPTLISPTGYEAGQEPVEAKTGERLPQALSLAERLRGALSQGGMTRIRAVLWPTDLPPPQQAAPVLRLPPLVHPAFWDNRSSGPENLPGLDLPEAFILYHGPHTPLALRQLMEAWNWAAGAIGDSSPLLLLGLDEAAREKLDALLLEYELDGTVLALPVLPPETIAALYHGCLALFHPATPSIWGGPVRLGLVSARPVVALENALSDALTGPAAYLVPGSASEPATSRALGAALVTVAVEESVSEALIETARQRSTAWREAKPAQALLAAYQTVLSSLKT